MNNEHVTQCVCARKQKRTNAAGMPLIILESINAFKYDPNMR